MVKTKAAKLSSAQQSSIGTIPTNSGACCFATCGAPIDVRSRDVIDSLVLGGSASGAGSLLIPDGESCSNKFDDDDDAGFETSGTLDSNNFKRSGGGGFSAGWVWLSAAASETADGLTRDGEEGSRLGGVTFRG